MKDALRPPTASESVDASCNEAVSFATGGPFGIRSGKASLETYASGLNDALTLAVTSTPSLSLGESWLIMDELG